jgi:hypothetical protein
MDRQSSRSRRGDSLFLKLADERRRGRNLATGKARSTGVPWERRASPPRLKQAHDVILETAVLDIREDQSDAFESSFAEARSLIAQTPGYQRCELRRCLEKRDRYLLLV